MFQAIIIRIKRCDDEVHMCVKNQGWSWKDGLVDNTLAMQG